MQRLIITAGASTGRCAACLQVDLPVVPVQFASEEVELYKTRGDQPISMCFCSGVQRPPGDGVRYLTRSENSRRPQVLLCAVMIVSPSRAHALVDAAVPNVSVL